jgi:hypothetical protein
MNSFEPPETTPMPIQPQSGSRTLARCAGDSMKARWTFGTDPPTPTFSPMDAQDGNTASTSSRRRSLWKIVPWVIIRCAWRRATVRSG